jgi:hypothetical protein
MVEIFLKSSWITVLGFRRSNSELVGCKLAFVEINLYRFVLDTNLFCHHLVVTKT